MADLENRLFHVPATLVVKAKTAEQAEAIARHGLKSRQIVSARFEPAVELKGRETAAAWAVDVERKRRANDRSRTGQDHPPPSSDHCPACGQPVYISTAHDTWACRDPACPRQIIAGNKRP